MYNFGSLILLRFLQTLERPTQITAVLLAMIYQQLSALHMPSFMIGWLVKEREKKLTVTDSKTIKSDGFSRAVKK